MSEFAIQFEKLRNLARLGAYVVIATGLIVLVAGWGMDLPTLRNVVPGTVEVKPSTAFALMLTGASVLLLVDPLATIWQKRIGRLLAFLVVVIGLAFLGEFLLGWNLGIDEIPFRDVTGRADGVTYPGRLAPATAVNLVLVGVALLTLDLHVRGRWHLGEILTIPVVLIAAMTVVAYMYEIPSFYEPDPSTKMALTTAACFIILSFSIVFMRPQGRLATLLSVDAPGGVMARWLVPILIVVPLLLGWGRLEAAEAGLIGDRMATWWFTATMVTIMLVVLGAVASKLNEVDEERKEAERKLYDQANLDSITGLWNRRRFRQELAGHATRTRRQGGTTALIAIGLDGLRDVDERYGHASGSALLEATGKAILKTIRVSDIAGRLSGGEFAVLLVGSSNEGARAVAEKLRLAVTSVWKENGNDLDEVEISTSVGLAHCSGPLADDGHNLLTLASEAMLEARRMGGNRTVADRSGTAAQPQGDFSVVIPARSGNAPERSDRRRTFENLGSRAFESRWLPHVASTAAAISFGVLLWDHFDPVGSVFVALAAVLLIGAVTCFLYFFRSVSRSRRHLETYERMRKQSAESSSDSLVTIDTEGTILEWNSASAQIFGCSRNEAIGRNLGEFIGAAGLHEWQRQGVAALTGGGAEPVLDEVLEVTAISERGGTFPVEMALSLIQGHPPRFVASIRDISERRSLDEEKERLAAIVRSSEDAIYSKDLNGVVTAWNKGAEALFGYSAAEAIGENITNLTVPGDRLDEDDAITHRVLEGGSAELVSQRQTKSGKLLEVSLRSFPIRDLRGEIVGVSISAHDITQRRLLEKQEALDAERRLWTGRIRDALADDRFVFFGQPVVQIGDGSVHHHELLIRMDLDGEIVTPDKFLPHAEASDLIVDIDRWAIRRGIEYGAICPVAINLSGRSLSVPGLSDYVEQTLREVGTEPSNVQFEVTETAAAENLEDARRLVGQLAALGCGSSLDDFGTGYGTFTYLRYLPVTELKIDVTFIRDLKEETDFRVVNSIIAVAKSFRMSTVAEGVEDEETLLLLDQLQVDLAQGYHIGRPGPMDQAIEELMTSPQPERR